MQFTQLSKSSPMELAEALWNKALRSCRVYDEYVWKGIFIESLPDSVSYRMSSFWDLKKSATKDCLARHETSFPKLQMGSPSTDAMRDNEKQDKRLRKSGHRGGSVKIFEWSWPLAIAS